MVLWLSCSPCTHNDNKYTKTTRAHVTHSRSTCWVSSAIVKGMFLLMSKVLLLIALQTSCTRFYERSLLMTLTLAFVQSDQHPLCFAEFLHLCFLDTEVPQVSEPQVTILKKVTLSFGEAWLEKNTPWTYAGAGFPVSVCMSWKENSFPQSLRNDCRGAPGTSWAILHSFP